MQPRNRRGERSILNKVEIFTKKMAAEAERVIIQLQRALLRLEPLF